MGKPLSFQPTKCIESVLTIEIAKPKLRSLRSGCAARFRVGGEAEPQLRLCQHYLPLLSLPFVKFYMNVSRRMRQIYSHKIFSLSRSRSRSHSRRHIMHMFVHMHVEISCDRRDFLRSTGSDENISCCEMISVPSSSFRETTVLPGSREFLRLGTIFGVSATGGSCRILAGIAILASVSERAPFAGLST